MKRKIIATLGMALLIGIQPCASAAERFQTDFENYTQGSVNGQHGWVSSEASDDYYAAVADDPVDSSNKSLLIYDANGTKMIQAQHSVGSYSGSETDGIVSAEFRVNFFNPQAYNFELSFLSGGTDRIFHMTAAYSSGVKMQLRHPEVGGTAGENVVSQSVASINAGSWYKVKCIMNFNTQTLDFYTTADENYPDEPTLANVPFASAGCTSLDTVMIKTNTYSSNFHMYFDDFYIGDGLRGSFDVKDNTATYSVSGNTANVSADLELSEPGVGAVTVITALYGENNRILGFDASRSFTEKDITNGVIPYSVSVPVSGEVRKAKIMLWDSLNKRFPYNEAVECSKN